MNEAVNEAAEHAASVTPLHTDDEARAFLVAYRRAFVSLETDAITAFYTVPCMGIGAGLVKVLSSAEEMRSNFGAVTEVYRAAGVVDMDFDLISQREVSGFVLELEVKWQVYRPRRQRWKMVHVTYILWRSPDGLKIANVYWHN
ncbi:hypothetical protein HSX11_25385 [Oxalobacteraceae bacterium]|nr:hypothetical protein [Oxalobacteraceae bacterium]